MANTFREVYKKTGTSSYQLVGNVGVGGIKLDIMKGASTSTAGEIGLVPKPSAGQQDYILTGNASFEHIDTVLSKSETIKNFPKYRCNTIAGSQSDQIATTYGSLIILGRDAAGISGIYFIDHWGGVNTIFETSSFAVLTFSNYKLTIKNNLNVAISYSIFYLNE